jgi:hypothetical protein
VSAPKRSDLETVLANVPASRRGGHSVEVVAATWRFAGIASVAEVEAWLEVGVFDGHRAGMLKLAGITPDELARAHDPYALGFAFAVGELSIAELRSLVAAFRATGEADPRETLVRKRRERK